MKIKKLISVSAIAFLFTFTFAPAASAAWLDYSIFIQNTNLAEVQNSVTTKANSGDNTAEGGNGGDAGDGGKVYKSDDDNAGGHGGNGGSGGEGGQILTGDAHAAATIVNQVNDVFTEFDRNCDCPEPEFDLEDLVEERRGYRGHKTKTVLDRSVRVINQNMAGIFNEAYTKSETGDNDADGGNGGDAGKGGSVMNSDDDNIGGNGGHGAYGGLGGLVSTGMSTTDTVIMNILNKVVTRIRN